MSHSKGPGYASPMEAFHRGDRETLLYVCCIVPSRVRPDYLATIDCDPKSRTYSKVSRFPVNSIIFSQC